MRRTVVVISLLVVVTYSTVTSASGTSGGWTLQLPRNRLIDTAQSIASIACTSATACTAVGSLENTGTLAERWNGASWAIEQTPPLTSFNMLTGVSCPTLTYCVAVGSASNPSNLAGPEGDLIETWNGKAWSVVAGGIGSLGGPFSAVSCSSASFCFAAGSAGLVEWNGTTWAEQEGGLSVPAGTSNLQLSGVACVSPKACTVVGTYTNSKNNSSTLAANWNGSAWSDVATPASPFGSSSSELGSVSCAASANCTALGSYEATPSRQNPLVERYTGGRWHVVSTPASWGPVTTLSGISCNSAGCTFVGDKIVDSAGDIAALAKHWNYSAWTAEAAAQPVHASTSELSAVSCTTTSCMAGGSYTAPNEPQRVFSESLHSASSTIHAMPAGGTDALQTVLNAVTCPSSTACTAVGASYGQSLAEQWNGKSWTVQLPPTASGTYQGYGYQDELLAIGCSSVNACTAVGDMVPDATGANGTETLVERWNGTEWTVEATPNPALTYVARLTGVACPSATSCTAVGYSTSIYGDRPASQLVEHWNGRSWSIVTMPNVDTQQGAESQLSAVACVSTVSCTAVGYYDNNASLIPVPLIENWNGVHWSVETAPSPAGTRGSFLESVSCPTATFCTAVGNDDLSGNLVTPSTFAETWNGQAWTVTTMAPTLPPVTSLNATGVSCASATACVAVGYARLNVSGPYQADVFAEVWNGSTWVMGSPSLPTTTGYAQLNGVGCSGGSPTGCTAVGVYSPAYSSSQFTLGERYAG